VAQQFVENGCARPADFAPARTAAVLDLKPVGFNLEKGLVTGKFNRGIASGWGGETLSGVEFDFSD
jgi:hypothetical protein